MMNEGLSLNTAPTRMDNGGVSVRSFGEIEERLNRHGSIKEKTLYKVYFLVVGAASSRD